MQNTEKTQELKNYIQSIIEDSGKDVLGNRAILNTSGDEKISMITKIMAIPADEEIIIFFDDSFTGNGKAGLVISSWGLRYKSGIPLSKEGNWNLSWDELCANYTMHKEGIISKDIVFRKGKDNLFTVEKKATLTSSTIEIEWLERIIKNSCKVLTGRNLPTPESQNSPIATPNQNSAENEPVAGSEKPADKEPTPAQKAEMEQWRREGQREYDKARDNADNLKNSDTSSFIRNNIIGIIVATAFVVLYDIQILANPNVSGGQKALWLVLNILQLPFCFGGYSIGNALRKALHPDFVIADGFGGLLKEKIFWKIGPQAIGALIGFGIGAGIASLITGINQY